MSLESDAYEKTKNLKLAAKSLGIPWHTLYSRLKKQGVAVVGDKSRYGSASDRVGCVGERIFREIVPCAIDLNENKFQAKCDFIVNNSLVDVKSSNKRMRNKAKSKKLSWAFSFVKQSEVADYFVCFGLDESLMLEKIFLIPSEFARGLQTLSIPVCGKSKWNDFVVSKEDLKSFFEEGGK